MAKLTRTIEVEGGEYLDKFTGEKVTAVCWKKDGDHPLVERYPIEGREFKGILVLGPKDKHALRFVDWIVEDEAGRMHVVGGSPRKVEVSRDVQMEGAVGKFTTLEDAPSQFEERYEPVAKPAKKGAK